MEYNSVLKKTMNYQGMKRPGEIKILFLSENGQSEKNLLTINPNYVEL